MANHQNLHAVIVADECLDATAIQLAKILQGVEHRARVVTIDNALKGGDKSDLRLTPDVDLDCRKNPSSPFGSRADRFPDSFSAKNKTNSAAG